MTDPTSLLVAELLKFGLPGVLLIAAGLVIWRLWGRVEELQDRRVDDAQKLIPVIEANTASRDEHTKAIESLRDSIMRQGRS
ncbi:MAG: hypothetical protein O9972_13020 [Burkholderiales bacterium]|nr:hypothetical protein [Burkholderiales bacterium]